VTLNFILQLQFVMLALQSSPVKSSGSRLRLHETNELRRFGSVIAEHFVESRTESGRKSLGLRSTYIHHVASFYGQWAKRHYVAVRRLLATGGCMVITSQRLSLHVCTWVPAALDTDSIRPHYASSVKAALPFG